MFKTIGTTLAITLIGFASFAQEQFNQQPQPPVEPNKPAVEQPTVVPPSAMFQQGTHMKMVIPCGPTGQLDRYLREKEKQSPLLVGKSYTHLLGPQGVELRTPGTQIMYVGDQLQKDTPFSIVIVFPNGLECLFSVGSEFTPVSVTN